MIRRISTLLLVALALAACGQRDVERELELGQIERIAFEETVVQLQFTQLRPNRYAMSFSVPGRSPTLLEAVGDKWKLESEVTDDGVLGLTTLRTQMRDAPNAVAIDLGDAYQWAAPEDVSHTQFNSFFMPMVDGATYDVRITPNGLIARPTNEPAALASAEMYELDNPQ